MIWVRGKMSRTGNVQWGCPTLDMGASVMGDNVGGGGGRN